MNREDLTSTNNHDYKYVGTKGEYLIERCDDLQVFFLSWFKDNQCLHCEMIDSTEIENAINFIENIEKETTVIKALRLVNKFTQKDLSNLSNVNLRMIQGYEQGTKDINKASAITVYRLAETLGCDVKILLNLE